MAPRSIFHIFYLLPVSLLSSSCEELELTPTQKMSTQPVKGTTSTTLNPYIFSENMEGTVAFSTAHDLDVGDWAYALQVVNTPKYRGTKAARFEIRKDQPLVASGKRSEVTIVKNSVTKEMWYSFAVYFPSAGYEYDTEREVINQWYQSGSPATSLRTQRDRIILESGNSTSTRKEYDLGPIVKNRWHTVVMHFVHSYGEDGLIELWYDGVKKATIKGGNMYDGSFPKWKIGLYKSAFKYTTSRVSRRVIFYDNIKVGNATATYETMQPAL